VGDVLGQERPCPDDITESHTFLDESEDPVHVLTTDKDEMSLHKRGRSPEFGEHVVIMIGTSTVVGHAVRAYKPL
jgi:hypothetical protein